MAIFFRIQIVKMARSAAEMKLPVSTPKSAATETWTAGTHPTNQTAPSVIKSYLIIYKSH